MNPSGSARLSAPVLVPGLTAAVACGGPDATSVYSDMGERMGAVSDLILIVPPVERECLREELVEYVHNDIAGAAVRLPGQIAPFYDCLELALPGVLGEVVENG